MIMHALAKCGQGPATTKAMRRGIAYDSFPALGSIAVLGVSDPGALDAARAAVREVVEAIDLACSRFRDDSEISALSRAGGAPVQVSPLLFEAVRASVRAAELTDGDVVPTLGSALRALGYDRDFDEVRRGGPARVRVTEVPGWRALALDERAQTIQGPAGVELDLGATAKALAADRAASAACSLTGAGVLL